jgi:hypothetical protein
VRPATTSIYGDTGLWFVPTGEVLRDGTWSASGYRVNWDVRQGFTDISHFEGTFAFGVANRAEIFGMVRFDTRIDRDTRPIFGFGGDRYGGVDNKPVRARRPDLHKFGDSSRCESAFIGITAARSPPLRGILGADRLGRRPAPQAGRRSTSSSARGRGHGRNFRQRRSPSR